MMTYTQLSNQQPYLTIHADGRITVSEKLQPSETAARVLECIKTQWMEDSQVSKIRELNERIEELERDIDRLNMRILSLKVAGQNVVYQATEMWKRVAIKEWLDLSSSHCIDYHEKVAEWNKAKEDKL